ncbi:MAG: ABC transporter permease [Enterococcus sp.]
MYSLIKRNLYLYFGSLSGIFFSLMGALISFLLYLVFLKQNMLNSWAQVPNTKILLDPWLIGGTLTVTAITTTANGLGQMIRDRESGTLADLSLTKLSFMAIESSYLCSTVIIGTIMQLILFFGMNGYFYLTDNFTVSGSIILLVSGLAVLSSIVWTTFNLLLFSFLKSTDSLGKISTILGTAAGFFAGVYLPIGMIPNHAQNLVQWTPAPYNAALYRQILMHDSLASSFSGIPAAIVKQFKETMGITLKNGMNLKQNLYFLAIFTFVFLGLTFLGSSLSRRAVLDKI